MLAIRSFMLAIRSFMLAIRSIMLAIRSFMLAIRSLMFSITHDHQRDDEKEKHNDDEKRPCGPRLHIAY